MVTNNTSNASPHHKQTRLGLKADIYRHDRGNNKTILDNSARVVCVHSSFDVLEQ
jgi:hypothetical protein